MDVILVPGLWLDAATWDEVTPVLRAAGHTPHPLTMPGVGATGAEAAGIGIAEWVAATVAEIDRLDGPVALVGHSGGGNVVWGAADARPERVAGVVFVDTFPPGDGQNIWEFPVVDGVVPFPGWDFFEEAEIADLDEETRARAAAAARAIPERVPADALALRDERRRSVPVTILTGTVPAADIRALAAEPPAWAAELAALERLDVVEIGTGHWPQFSAPARLGAAIVAAIG